MQNVKQKKQELRKTPINSACDAKIGLGGAYRVFQITQKRKPLCTHIILHQLQKCLRWIPITLAFGLVSLTPALLRAQTLPAVTSGTLLLQLKADAGVTVDGTRERT